MQNHPSWENIEGLCLGTLVLVQVHCAEDGPGIEPWGVHCGETILHGSFMFLHVFKQRHWQPFVETVFSGVFLYWTALADRAIFPLEQKEALFSVLYNKDSVSLWGKVGQVQSWAAHYKRLGFFSCVGNPLCVWYPHGLPCHPLGIGGGQGEMTWTWISCCSVCRM